MATQPTDRKWVEHQTLDEARPGMLRFGEQHVLNLHELALLGLPLK